MNRINRKLSSQDSLAFAAISLTLLIIRARILGKMDYFYFLRHMYETCL
jgi:hypothetical protein